MFIVVLLDRRALNTFKSFFYSFLKSLSQNPLSQPTEWSLVPYLIVFVSIAGDGWGGLSDSQWDLWNCLQPNRPWVWDPRGVTPRQYLSLYRIHATPEYLGNATCMAEATATVVHKLTGCEWKTVTSKESKVFPTNISWYFEN